MDNKVIELKNAVHIHQAMTEYRDMQYLNMIQRINTQTKAILTDDMGSQFVQNCARDLAGEVVRNCFDTSDYNITVDQLAMRILKFSYEDEYDPLAKNGGVGEVKKLVYNYNEIRSGELDKISAEMETYQVQLFEDERKSDNSTRAAQQNYRAAKTDADGNIRDELTGDVGTSTTYINPKTGQKHSRSDLQADHRQARESATYNSRYLTGRGVDEMRRFWNSSDNFQMMHASANASKGDIRVCEVDGKIKYVNARSNEYNPKTDITYKATPEQLADAVCTQWERVDAKRAGESSNKIKTLKEKGYLNEEGKVPKSVRRALVQNIRHSQNKESITFLENANYGAVAVDAATILLGGKREEKNENGETVTVKTKGAIGKIIAGQIIYYAAPPLVYELRCFLSDKKAKLDDVLTNLGQAIVRIGDYVFSKLKDMFKNILANSLKKFIKSFMDILINAVKATVKKLLKIAKNLVLSTVDAVRIIADKNATASQKADSVVQLFGATITSCVIEVLFELAADALHIPEPFDDIIFGPLQILATVVCTNLTMLILQKADLFDVRFGYKMAAIKQVFDEERTAFAQDLAMVEQYAYGEIDQIIQMARERSMEIYNELQQLNPKNHSVRGQLESINQMFSMDVNFDAEWTRFLGIEVVAAQ